jgi:hypothetical protein
VNVLAAVFTNPMVLNSQTFWLIIPVSVAVAIVYKTVRTTNLRRLPLEIVRLSLYILVSEAALMIAGWVFLALLV